MGASLKLAAQERLILRNFFDSNRIVSLGINTEAMHLFTRVCSGLPLVALLAAGPAMKVAASDKPRSWPPNQFAPVTLERIAALPAVEQLAWKAYWDASQEL